MHLMNEKTQKTFAAILQLIQTPHFPFSTHRWSISPMCRQIHTACR